jgi:amidase
MSVKGPMQTQLEEIVVNLHMNMPAEEIARYLSLMRPGIEAYARVDELPDFLPEVKYPRDAGFRPTPDENHLNAWYIKTKISGAPIGPLAGRSIVLKDNICLAGVPMMNGSATLEGYVPDMDATVVTRILDAGGTIVGKAHCEGLCLSGGSHTNATGPVHNPYRRGYTTGGSSSGCAALVASGEVEMAIGGDQGGSIRMPAAFSGCYGMKPTHGLVPYTGIMPIEATIDHAGPMTQSVSDNALLLEVIAGADGLDPRQYAPRVSRYRESLGKGIAGLKIGVIREGFGHANSEAEVDAKVQAAAEQMKSLGAVVESISIPAHLDGLAIWTPIAVEGLQVQMMAGNAAGFNWKGAYNTGLLERHARWRERADELSPSLKLTMMIGEFYTKHYGGRYYAKAQNLARWLRQAYDSELQRYDLLLLPTVPMKARKIPSADAPLEEIVPHALDMIANTSPFDVTGHPAMSIPCGKIDGLPVGLMLVGRHWNEGTIYRAAHAFEQATDWRER